MIATAMSSPKKSGGKAARRARLALQLPTAKPRNPVVRALAQREAAQNAGPHRVSGKAERRRQKIALAKQPLD